MSAALISDDCGNVAIVTKMRKATYLQLNCRLDSCKGDNLLIHRADANIFHRIWSLWICTSAISGIYLGRDN